MAGAKEKFEIYRKEKKKDTIVTFNLQKSN